MIPTTSQDPLAKPATELTQRQLRDLIGEAVYRGVAKAIGVYLFVSALFILLFYVVRSS